MAKQVINLGAAGNNGAGGDDRRSAWLKGKANFTELYNWLTNRSDGDDTATALPNALPVARGGTGGRTPAEARTGLELGAAATRSVGLAAGNLMEIGPSQAVNGNAAFALDGSRFISYVEGVTTGMPPGVSYAAGIRSRYGDGSYFAMDLVGNILNGNLHWRSVNSTGVTNAWRTIYDTSNTTRAADGTLKAI